MPRVIGILGASFVGSTILNTVLDGLPNVFGAGETIWAYNNRGKDKPTCQECHAAGRECPIWTDEFQRKCHKNAENWWSKIAEQAGAEVVVTSDKMPHLYGTLGDPDMVILMWKDIRAWVVSYYRRSRAGWPTSMTDEDIGWCLDKWTRHYRIALDWLRNKKLPWIAVQLEDFVMDQPGTLRRICEFADLEYDESALDIWSRPHHQVACNAMAKKIRRSKCHVKTFGDGIKLDERWRDVLTPEQAKNLEEYAPVICIEESFRCRC